MLAVLSEEKVNGETLNNYECGGSLIHPKVALTGAHCVRTKTANKLLVRAGEWDTQTTKEIYAHQVSSIKLLTDLYYRCDCNILIFRIVALVKLLCILNSTKAHSRMILLY